MIVAKHGMQQFDAVMEVRKVYKLNVLVAAERVSKEWDRQFESIDTSPPDCSPALRVLEEDPFLNIIFDEADDSFGDAEAQEAYDFSDEVAGALEGDLCAWKEAAEEAGSTEPSDFEPDEDWLEANAQANEEASEAASLETIVAEALVYYPDKKVAAIKHVRNITGLGLKEAKAAVDEAWGNDILPPGTVTVEGAVHSDEFIGDVSEWRMRDHVS
jgi:hypothetical protein